MTTMKIHHNQIIIVSTVIEKHKKSIIFSSLIKDPMKQMSECHLLHLRYLLCYTPVKFKFDSS